MPAGLSKVVKYAVAAGLSGLVSFGWGGPHAVAAGGRALPDTPAAERSAELPDPGDAALTRLSERGHFRVSLRNLGPRPAPINKIHSWVVRVETPDGQPVTDVEIEFEGSMPDHGHGFPTRPRLAPAEDPGSRRIEGVKFNMAGLWRFEFRLRSGAVADRVRFDMQLED